MQQFNSYNGFAEELNESLASRQADTDAQEESINAIERTLDSLGIKVHYGTKIGKYPQTVILDIKHEDNAIYILPDGKVLISGYDEGKVDPEDKKAVEQMLIEFEFIDDKSVNEAQDIYDIQGQAVRDARRKEVLDEFKEIFTDEPGGINLDNKETLAIVRGYLEDMGYVVEVSETQNASHPIHIEWFK